VKPNPFIPAWLDELDLKPAAFRLYCHLWRRGDTYSSASTMAKICRIKRDTVFVILGELEAAGLIRRITRNGQTSLIEPVPPNGATPHKGTPPQTGQDPPPETGHHPSPQTGHKGNPIKVSPLRNPKEELFEPESMLPFPTPAFAEAWNDWKQHRAEIKKKLTPQSIKQQLRNFAEWGEARSIAAIRFTIGNGWQGIREPDAPRNGHPAKPITPALNTGTRREHIERIRS
jgi:DNA-binding transcriptional MocR family regulator